MNRILYQEKDIPQDRCLDRLTKKVVVSPWRTPIPFEERKTTPVVVYFYSNSWIPMKCFSLAEAIELYRKALLIGKKIIVYPADLDPYTQRITTPPCEGGEGWEALAAPKTVTYHNRFRSISSKRFFKGAACRITLTHRYSYEERCAIANNHPYPHLTLRGRLHARKQLCRTGTPALPGRRNKVDCMLLPPATPSTCTDELMVPNVTASRSQTHALSYSR
jgi:hypothetical protein